MHQLKIMIELYLQETISSWCTYSFVFIFIGASLGTPSPQKTKQQQQQQQHILEPNII